MCKKIVILCISLAMLMPLWARNIVSFDFDEYDIRIYYPEDYNKVLMTNGVIFHSEEYNTAFSMLVSESDLPPEKHIQYIEDRYNAVNLIDSSEIYLNNKELETFGVDSGVRSYFKYEEDEQIINKSLLVLKKGETVYMIITQFAGGVPDEEITIVNDCIRRFRADYNE